MKRHIIILMLVLIPLLNGCTESREWAPGSPAHTEDIQQT